MTRWHRIHRRYGIVILVASIAGLLGIQASQAAIYSISAETEQAVLSGNAQITGDLISGASGNSAVSFGRPAEPSVSCPAAGNIVNVASASQLASALRDAQPGDVIQMADGTYTGKFTASASGTVAQPITIRGSSRAIIHAGTSVSGNALKIQGTASETGNDPASTRFADYWCISGITIIGGTTAVMVDLARHAVITGVTIRDTGQEGIHFKSCSSDGILADSRVTNTGLITPGYGEGIYIGTAQSNWDSLNNCTRGSPDPTDNVQIINNTVDHVTAESIDIKEGTRNGVIRGNTFDVIGMTGEHFGDSAIELKGAGYTIDNNIVKKTGASAMVDGFQVRQVSAMLDQTESATRNSFTNNRLLGAASGYGISILPANASNFLACSNTSDAIKGLTNVSSGCE